MQNKLMRGLILAAVALGVSVCPHSPLILAKYIGLWPTLVLPHKQVPMSKQLSSGSLDLDHSIAMVIMFPRGKKTPEILNKVKASFFFFSFVCFEKGSYCVAVAILELTL